MTHPLFPAVLMIISALLHACIGVLLKQSNDKLIFRTVVALVSALVVLPFAFFYPLPPASAWGWLIVGAVVHFIYQLSQISAFERGDMSLVYPVMRGSAPLLAAGFAFLILSEPLLPIELAGLTIATLALIGFSWPQRARPKGVLPALGFAIICGVMIALYSVIDAGGMRISKAFHMGNMAPYIIWFFILDMVGLLIYSAFRYKRRWPDAVRAGFGPPSIGAILSLGSFGLALIAYSLAPVAKMAAMRETSVVFGAILAVLILKEPMGTRRIGLACVLALGLIIMQMAG